MAKWAESRDGNEKEIIKALVKAGATVQKMTGGNGRPDLLVGYRGQDFKLEVKNPATATKTTTTKSVKVADVDPGGQYHELAMLHGRDKVRMLKLTQARWLDRWAGSPTAIVLTSEEALRAIGATP